MLIKSGGIQCTPAPPNVSHNPLPNHRNQRANTITLEKDYELKGTITEATRTPPWATPLITV